MGKRVELVGRVLSVCAFDRELVGTVGELEGEFVGTVDVEDGVG